jgi:hypothetical protein
VRRGDRGGAIAGRLVACATMGHTVDRSRTVGESRTVVESRTVDESRTVGESARHDLQSNVSILRDETRAGRRARATRARFVRGRRRDGATRDARGANVGRVAGDARRTTMATRRARATTRQPRAKDAAADAADARRGKGAASTREPRRAELRAEKAARWPMCMAIAIEKTTVVRGVVVACAAVALAVALTLMDWSDDGAGAFLRKIRWALNPLSVFVACELNVLITAFVVLFPVTYAQAAIDEREGVEESDTLRLLKLPAIVAEFAVGSKVAIARLGDVIVRDFSLFMVVYLSFAGYWLALDGDPIDSGVGASSVHEMEGGVSVHSLVQ